jgi:multisubunit Na+/H+ antiporter MnhG subunit
MKTNTLTGAELRRFAWLMMGAFSVIGTLALWRDKHTLMLACFSIASLFLIFGLALPLALCPVYKGWMWLARVLAWINTRIILTLFFYAVMTPVSLLMKLFGRDALNLKFDRSRETYWHPRAEIKPAKERYQRLF